MKVIRYWVRFLFAFFERFKGILFLGIIIGFFIFIGIYSLMPYLTDEGVEIIGISGRYRTDELPKSLLNQIGDGLTKLDDSGSPQPALAESWEAQDNGKTWVFRLKEGLVWHDGSKVTTADIDYAFDDVIVEKPDERTIIFRLKDSFAPFPVVVSKPVFKKGLLGTGEWKVKKLSLTTGYVEKLGIFNESGKQKDYYFFPTEERAKTAFKLGQVDILQDVLDPKPFNTWSTAQIYEDVNTNLYVGIFFNNDAEPFKDNKDLRQALSYAINKESFNATRALGPISPNSWAYNPQIKTYEYDKEHALELLNNTPEEVRAEMDVKLVTTPVLLSVAESVADYWKDVNINTTVQVSSVIPEQFDAFLAIYDIPPDPDQYSVWHSKQINITNLSRFNNIRINKLLEDGRLSMDREERRSIYLDFQRFILEEAPAVFLHHPVTYTIVRR